MIRALALLCLVPAAAAGADPESVPYDSLRQVPHRIETFDTLPPTPEPGLNFDQHWRAPGLSIGERLAGQELRIRETDQGRFDRLTGAPVLPLSVVPGAARSNIAIAHHRGFGSNALFPLGPAGIDAMKGRGEGSVAIVFDHPQPAFGLRLHAEYPDPLGARPAPGRAELHFYDSDARPLARHVVTLRHGVLSLAWRSATGVAAFTLQTTDPGGIAIDDILYEIVDLSG